MRLRPRIERVHPEKEYIKKHQCPRCKYQRLSPSCIWLGERNKCLTFEKHDKENK